MKFQKPNRHTQELLKRWGVPVILRPDYWDGRNRSITIIVDETVPFGDVIFEDGITYRMNTDTLDDNVSKLSENVYDDFIIAFVYGVNAYAKWNQVIIRKEDDGLKWLKDAISRIECVFDMYKLDIKHFGALDWKKCCVHFGGEHNLNQIIADAIAYRSEELFSLCMICKNCKCEADGRRYCTRVYVPTDEYAESVITLRRITDDQPLSNDIIDIIPTFKNREQCSCFEKNETRFIDQMIKFRDK
jgi:hypothetical protein